MAERLGSSGKLFRFLGPALFLLILFKIDVGRTLQTLGALRLSWLGAALMLYPLLVLLKAWRWRLLLRQQGTEYTLASAFLAYNSSLAVGYVTPGRLGEFVKALYLRKDLGLTAGRAFSSVLLERLLDLYALTITALVGMVIFAMPRQLVALALPVLAAVGLLPLLVLVPHINRSVMALAATAARNLVPEPHREDVTRSLSGFQRGIQELLSLKLLLPVGVTVVAYALFYSQSYLVAASLRLPISYGFAAFCVSLGSLMALLPLSISGLGVRDLTFVVVLGTVGLAPETAVSYSLLFLVVFNVFGGLIGGLAWFLKPLR
jgi:uncharacterized protein (TIRG00374 family)